jgi:ketosteroid isomerase-like protein
VKVGLIAVVAALALNSVAASASNPAVAAEIATLRGLRSENNTAMAARDLGKTMAIVADDYVLVGGNDGIHRSKTDMQTAWAAGFADPKGLPCVRKAERFDIGEYRGVNRAAETGSWECPHATGSGEERLSGQYLAHWSKRSGTWKVVSDNYVTLACSGPGCNFSQ